MQILIVNENLCPPDLVSQSIPITRPSPLTGRLAPHCMSKATNRRVAKESEYVHLYESLNTDVECFVISVLAAAEA